MRLLTDVHTTSIEFRNRAYFLLNVGGIRPVKRGSYGRGEKKTACAFDTENACIATMFEEPQVYVCVYRAFVCECRISEWVGQKLKKKTRTTIKACGSGRSGEDERVKRIKVKRLGIP